MTLFGKKVRQPDWDFVGIIDAKNQQKQFEEKWNTATFDDDSILTPPTHFDLEINCDKTISIEKSKPLILDDNFNVFENSILPKYTGEKNEENLQNLNNIINENLSVVQQDITLEKNNKNEENNLPENIELLPQKNSMEILQDIFINDEKTDNNSSPEKVDLVNYFVTEKQENNSNKIAPTTIVQNIFKSDETKTEDKKPDINNIKNIFATTDKKPEQKNVSNGKILDKILGK